MTIKLTQQQYQDIAQEFDALYKNTKASLGDKDYRYIKRVIRFARGAEITGRVFLQFSFEPITWLVGVSALSVSKIVENMEISHNVLHGQYDWTHDPEIFSLTYEPDGVGDPESWRVTHNVEHHNYTNIIGKDRDFGFEVFRLSETQKWSVFDLLQPLKCALLMLLFDWGVSFYWLEREKLASGEKTLKDKLPFFKRFGLKALGQLFKEYIFFPLIAWHNWSKVLVGNLVANVVRNLWASMIIFCGHFTAGVSTFTPEECQNETKGQWYVRQILGSSNLEGSKLLYFMSGHLSHQIEHHLFPDLPSHRYQEIQPQVKAICKKYGIPYNTGSLAKQFGSVLARIWKHTFPSANKAQIATK